MLKEEAGAETEVAETLKKVDKLLKEQKETIGKKLDARTKKYKGRFVDVLMESIKSEEKEEDDKIRVYDKNVKINKEIDGMINDINEMLDE